MAYSAAVITVSDKGYAGEREDTSGPAVAALLEEHGYEVLYRSIVPDEKAMIEAELIACADERKLSLIVTTGGTGFSPRDITPEATKAVIERETPGIPQVMIAESLKITPRACLSRMAAGIRGRSLIVNLPGSKRAATENLSAVVDALDHGLQMLLSEGSANCAESDRKNTEKAPKQSAPSMDVWLREAKESELASQCGMYLFHNGVVRETAKAQVRMGDLSVPQVTGMHFSYNAQGVAAAVEAAKQMPGIYYVRAWLNEGELAVGDDIMLVLIGGDIRPHVIDALQTLVGQIKNEYVVEEEKH